MAAVLAEFLAGALGSITTKVVVFPFETVRVVLAVRKENYKVRSLALACHCSRQSRYLTWLRVRAIVRTAGLIALEEL
jgi:hypothetical protein